MRVASVSMLSSTSSPESITCGASVTYVPTPCRRTTSPRSSNERIASRSVARETPSRRARSGSEGK